MSEVQTPRGRPKGRSKLNAGDEAMIAKIVKAVSTTPELTMGKAISNTIAATDTGGRRRLERKIQMRGGIDHLVASYNAKIAAQPQAKSASRTMPPAPDRFVAATIRQATQAASHPDVSAAIAAARAALGGPAMKSAIQQLSGVQPLIEQVTDQLRKLPDYPARDIAPWAAPFMEIGEEVQRAAAAIGYKDHFAEAYESLSGRHNLLQESLDSHLLPGLRP